jgi:hypothetical protein
MNVMKVMIFLIIFNFMLVFFASLGVYQMSSSLAVNSTAYSSFTTTDPGAIIISIFGGAGLLALVATGIGAAIGVSPLLSGAIGFMTGIVLTTTLNTIVVFNNIGNQIPYGLGTVLTGLITVSTIIFFVSLIWYIKQMISGGEEFYEG